MLWLRHRTQFASKQYNMVSVTILISNEPSHACGIIIYNARHELFFTDDEIVSRGGQNFPKGGQAPLAPPLAPALLGMCHCVGRLTLSSARANSATGLLNLLPLSVA